MEEIIKKIIANQFGVPPTSVANDMCVRHDFNSDSLDIVEIVMEIEGEFNIEIEEEELTESTVGFMIDLVKAKLAK
jgi:acyl carrier protein